MSILDILTDEQKENLYVDYVNNFTSIEGFANSYCIGYDLAKHFLTTMHEKRNKEDNKPETLYLAVNRINDSVRTVSYYKNADGSVTILSYSWRDTRGYQLEESLPKAWLILNQDCIAKELIVFNKDGSKDTLEVDNPCHAYDYGCPEQYLKD